MEIIKSFKLEVDEKFTMETHVLICESVLLYKYKVAKMKNLTIVTKQWLIDSYQQKKLLKTDQYEVKIFQNLNFYLYKLNNELTNNLSKFICEMNGIIDHELQRDQL